MQQCLVKVSQSSSTLRHFFSSFVVDFPALAGAALAGPLAALDLGPKLQGLVRKVLEGMFCETTFENKNRVHRLGTTGF